MKPNTPNIAEIRLGLDELSKEIRTIPTDAEGRAQPVEYDEHYVRKIVLSLILRGRSLCDEVERQSEENTDLSKRLNHALIERDGARRAAEAYRKENESLSETLDSANNATEALNVELDYERQENKRLRNFMERIHAAFYGGVTDLEVARKMASLAGEALRRDTQQ